MIASITSYLVSRCNIVRQTVRHHRPLFLILLTIASFYILFPFRLQAPEVYGAAAGIEKYQDASTTFALAQGRKLPDFGRYHPNHPIGHVIAALAFDYLNIAALNWMRVVNAVSALCAGCMLYLISLGMGLNRNVAALTTALFLGSYAAFLAVLSGEWHMPALALSLTGLWRLIPYITEKKTRGLYEGSALLCFAASYHLAAISILVPIGLVILFIRPLKEHYREIVLAGGIVLVPLIVVYFVVPIILFDISSPEDFFGLFFIYRYLEHIRYSGLDWPIMLVRSLSHAFVHTPTETLVANSIVFSFLLTAAVSAYFFLRTKIDLPLKFIIGFILLWPIGPAITGSRVDAMNGWLFMVPILSLVIATAISTAFSGRWSFVTAIIPVLLFAWNFASAALPHRFMSAEDIFFFRAPSEISTSTPIAFVIGNPVLSRAETWHAGSNLGFRNQTLFFPCCGEKNYYARLREWMRINPGFILVSDGDQKAIEDLLRSRNLQYDRYVDRRAEWPASFVPVTLFHQHDQSFRYFKRLTVWLPQRANSLP